MCQADLTVIRGRLWGRLAALAAVVAVAPALSACGGDDAPEQTTAPAQTGASTSTSETSATDPGETPEAKTSGGGPADDENAIVATLEAVLSGNDPAVACGDSVTERFLRRSYGDAAGCVAAQKNAKPASDAGVTQVVVLPDSVAQALARPKGGIYAGQKLRAELVLDDDAWRLDSLRSNVPVGP